MFYSLYLKLYKMCDSLVEAAQFIKSSDNGQICLQLLTGSDQLLSIIETALKDDEKSVKDKKIFEMLTDCGKTTGKLRESIISGEGYKDIASELNLNVSGLQKLLKGNIDTKFKILFFAELGQKWDSMSSLYEAFKERKDCDVAVVLAPIFRRVTTEKGETKLDVIYQDYLTPLGIEHIPYQQYDISKDMPDIVFISNPYEDVTPPQFWPENIAKYTRVVYVPYYTERVIDNESINAHCRMKVANCAWKIIAQSRIMKDTHVKYSPKHGENVVVTGLPKWDNIFELKAKPSELPEEWERKLKGKKVFLWNTHFNVGSQHATLLEYGKAILELFSCRDDIALIWRPHPMTATIFKLYIPQYQQYWESLIDAVEKSDNMIMDKNISYTLSFQCSDALITDFSSIMAQYMLTEKPVLWLKKVQADKKEEEPEYMVRINCLDKASSPKKIADFIDRIVMGIDSTKEERLKVMQEDMPSADGCVGKRTCDLLMEELRKECDAL